MLRPCLSARSGRRSRPDKLLVYRSIFPQMAGWLPEEEAAQLRFEFNTEMARLKAA